MYCVDCICGMGCLNTKMCAMDDGNMLKSTEFTSFNHKFDMSS